MKQVPKKAKAGSPISMYELSRELSTHIATALKQPLHVHRYSSPCVCIISADLWGCMNSLNSYIPKGHVLVELRKQIDAVLVSGFREIFTVADRCESGLDLSFVIRAWVLQILYSLNHAGLVYTRLIHDMLWRWFVGFEGHSDSLPDEELFVQDVQLVSDDPGVIGVVYRYLNDNLQLMDGSTDLLPNLGYLQTLHAQHHGQDAADTETDGAEWQHRMSKKSYRYSEGFTDARNVVYLGTGTDIFASSSCLSVDSTSLGFVPGQQGIANVVDILSRK